MCIAVCVLSSPACHHSDHRSTLLYRLEKIRNILKTDFSDPQELLYLLLSFYLIEMEDKH